MEKLGQKFRSVLLERFGADIQLAKEAYSSHNYAFVFPGEFVIRVNLRYDTHEEDYWMGELSFLADAHSSGAAVCAPLPSLKGNFLEIFESEDGKTYAAVKFIKAEGAAVKGSEINAKHARQLGETLGLIHRASVDAAHSGKTYCRSNFLQTSATLAECVDSQLCDAWLAEDVRKKMRAIIGAIRALPAISGKNYGIIHSDFTHYNYFTNGENIQVFDFDDCQYGYYMYDIATLMLMWLTRADANMGLSSAQAQQTLLRAFREGYDLHMMLEPDEWGSLTLFMQYRQALTIINLINSMAAKREKIAGGDGVLPSLVESFAAEDLFAGIDRRLEASRQKLQKIQQLLSSGANNPESAKLLELLNSDDMKPFVAALLGDKAET